MGRKKTAQTYIQSTSITKIFDILFRFKTLDMILLELTGIWLVLAWTGPFRPHAHSILIFSSPFSLAGMFIDAFIVLSTGTACPTFRYWGSWLQFQFQGHLVHVRYRLINTRSLGTLIKSHSVHTSLTGLDGLAADNLTVWHKKKTEGTKLWHWLKKLKGTRLFFWSSV